MAEQQRPHFTQQELLEQAAGNWNALGEIYRPIMEFLDLDYEWERWQETTTLRVRRR